MYFANNPTKMATKNQRAFLALRTPFMHVLVLLCTYQTLKTYAARSQKQPNPGQLAVMSHKADEWSTEYKMRMIDIRRL